MGKIVRQNALRRGHFVKIFPNIWRLFIKWLKISGVGDVAKRSGAFLGEKWRFSMKKAALLGVKSAASCCGMLFL